MLPKTMSQYEINLGNALFQGSITDILKVWGCLMKSVGKVSGVLFLSILMMATVGCKGKKPTSGNSSLPSTDGNGNATEISNNAFFVQVFDEDNYTSYTSIETPTAAFDTDCSISADASAGTDMVCRVDVLEGDIYFHDMNFQFNSPPGICEYIEYTPPWYYHWESGRGPTSITSSVTINGDTGAIVSCSASINGGAVRTDGGDEILDTGDNADFTEVSIDCGTLVNSCAYDHTLSDGPNCCYGAYNLDTTIITVGSSPSVQNTNTNESWGENIGECLGGNGAFNWQHKTNFGLPTSFIYNVPDEGLLEKIDNESAIKVAKSRYNIMGANDYDRTGATYDHTHTGFVSGTTSTKPYAVDPIDDRNGSPMVSGQDSFEYQCLDDAWDVIHRIRVYVKEWNTYAEWLTFVASSGASGDADVEGTEGIGCNSENATIGGPCNDKSDFDDILANEAITAGGLYDTSTATNRSSFFPNTFIEK